MILDLNEFFSEFDTVTYCVIKPDSDLPNYKKGSDLDIFCYNIDILAKIILRLGNQYLDKNLDILVTNMGAQTYIDFIHTETGNIEFRFDLYEKLPLYQNILIKPAFFENVLENRILVDFQNGCNIYTPCPIDDHILRYIEYQEWYGQRPDKIKHINYILETCDLQEKNNFLEKLHHYTKLPLVEDAYPVKIKRNNSLKVFAKKLLSKLPDNVKSFLKRFI